MSLATGPTVRVPRRQVGGGAWPEATRPRLPRLLWLAWGALFFNVLTPSANPTVVPIPHALNQLFAQGSLLVALVIALVINPRIVIRPTLFLALLSVMAVIALLVSIHSNFLLGSTYRAFRLLGFVTCLWLLTPWWGRRDLALLRVHRLSLGCALASAALGAALAPGKAFSYEGRLGGAIWPMEPTGVAHYAAVLFGTSVLLWMCRVIRGRHALVTISFSAVILLSTHTRTALTGALVGLAIGTGSLLLGHARARRTSVATLAAAAVGGAFFAPEILSWAARGQSAQQASELTGRTSVWTAVSETSRPILNEVFGSGLSNKSFNGVAVDSSWVATYVDLGWVGVGLGICFLLSLLALAVSRPRGPRRAIALFLITYCLVSSLTETGLGDASPFLLDLVVAASLLVPEANRGVR